ncbi:MAG: LamG domain-containing protein [Verrucomicrobiota bacterium]
MALAKLRGNGLTNTASLAFDGAGDAVDLGSPPSLQFSNALTIECSIFPGNTTTIMNLVTLWGYGGCAWVLNLNTADPNDPGAGTVPGLIGFLTSRDGSWWDTSLNQLASKYRVKSNEWTHIAAVFDGASMKLYVNGVLDVSGPASGSIQRSGLKVYLGHAADGSPWRFAGLMDEVRVTGAALTPDQFLYQIIPPSTVRLTQAVPQPSGGLQVSLEVSNLWFRPNYSVALEHCHRLGDAWQTAWTAPVSGSVTNCELVSPESSVFYRARVE